MRKVVYALVLLLVVVSELLFAGREIKNETSRKSSQKPFSIGDRKADLKHRKKWEDSPQQIITPAFRLGNVSGSLQDKKGNLWFVTSSEGVYCYDGKSFKNFTTKDGLGSNNGWCILEDKDGMIWLGTDAGVSRYDGKTFATIEIPLSNHTPPNTYWSKYIVFSIMQAKSGKLWFATIDGVYIYDGKSFTSFTVNEGGGGYLNNKNNVERILEDKAGNIWFGGRSDKGVFRYDGKSVTNLKLEELKGHIWARPLLQDKNGNIWFGNWGGAYRYDGKSFTSFTKDDDLGMDVVTSIIEDKNGNLWFGGDGVSRYDGKTFTHFSGKDGVWTILEDKSGNVWLGTRNGICRYDGKTFTSFSE